MQDRIVVVIGSPGTGKSTFIEYATCRRGQIARHELRPCATGIETFRTTHPADGLPVVFIDTPGSDNESWSVNETLAQVAQWLKKSYQVKVALTAVIYLHRISDNRVDAPALQNFQEFEKSCGQVPNVTLATTMWSKVQEKIGAPREEQLRTRFWKGIASNGGRIHRFSDTYESAWTIIGNLPARAENPVSVPWGTLDGQQSSKEQNADIPFQVREKLSRIDRDGSVMHSQQVSKQDRVVVVIGFIGVGKSTFIERATRQDGGTVGHGLESCTTVIRTVRLDHPSHGYPVAFVDTPGFGDPHKSDTGNLAMIAEWFTQSKIRIDTIIYLHRISDNRMNGSVRDNLRLLAKLLGSKGMPNVVIATTMWSKVSEAEGIAREKELKSKFWNGMLADGCRIERFKDTHESAWRIIDRAQDLPGNAPLLLNNTRVGITLNEELEKLINDQKAARGLRELVNSRDNKLAVQELNGRQAELEETVRRTATQLRQMKIPVTKRVRLFLRGRG